MGKIFTRKVLSRDEFMGKLNLIKEINDASNWHQTNAFDNFRCMVCDGNPNDGKGMCKEWYGLLKNDIYKTLFGYKIGIFK